MICYRCKNNIPRDAVKCPICGVKAMPFVGAKSCPECGTVNPVSARYCINDGFSFETPNAATYADRYADRYEEEAEEEAEEEEEQENMRPVAAKPKKKKHGVLRLFMWLFIAMVCLIGSAVVGYNVFKPKVYQIEGHAADALANAGLTDVSVKVDLSKTAKLTGTVKSAGDKAAAETIVKKIEDIIKVENNIIVSQLVPKPEELEKVINAALNAQGFPGVAVSVNTALTASIIGTVPSEFDRNKALAIVKSNRDVKDIKDNLNVDASIVQPVATVEPVASMTRPVRSPLPSTSPTPAPSAQPEPTPASTPEPLPHPSVQPQPHSDAGAIEGAINSSLKSAGLSKVTAEVNENLEVTLKGTVSNARDKNKAFDTIKHVKGVRKIKDHIFVVE
ncbi:MAG: BON domain-containing protein [Candidatus Magnetominusculus sp. LBB02]|nr:BON domain-containing protein [Candidatus Magnetominusculus sp. LBB02]